MEPTSPPLSFPAILRHPGLQDRYAHLHSQKGRTEVTSASTKKIRHEGKRWIRRKDNAHFVGNPHVVAPTKHDYVLRSAHIRSTFPEPLPPYLSRNAKLPTTTRPTQDPNSANAGRFSLSLKGMRRELRKSGFRAQVLVRSVEDEIIEWLQAGGTVLAPDVQDRQSDPYNFPGIPVGDTGTISEVSRTPLRLVWSIPCDAFARYVVHCCARYHEVVSFSKELSGKRLTYLLRPNVIRPDYHAQGNFDTPPVTDYSSHPDTDSDRDLVPGPNTDSDAEQAHLSPISEDSSVHPSPPPSFAPPPQIDDDAWSIIGDTDAEGDKSGSETALAASFNSLSMLPDSALLDANEASTTNKSIETDRTPRADLARQQASLRHRFWDRHHRSASSPSRSPARRLHRHRLGPFPLDPPRSRRLATPHRPSFYDYLFS